MKISGMMVFLILIYYYLKGYSNVLMKVLLESKKLPFLFSNKNLWLYLISGLIFLGLLFLILKNIICFFQNNNVLKKISFQGNEIEILQDEDSYFDKYLNEVIYVFENSGADVIIFEDIDRYETNIIFERLREINDLVNKKLTNKKKIIRFFYLLRDDIFNSKDRTKFFDYIIPVIPIVDKNNSYNKIIEIFRTNGKNGRENIKQIFKNKNFMEEVSLYIDDMRVLKNVYNEFILYDKKLGKTKTDRNKLFAFIL